MTGNIHTLDYLLTNEAPLTAGPGSYVIQYLQDFMVSIAANTVSTSRILTSGTTFLATDRYIFSNSTSAPITYTLFASPVSNQMITIKDYAGTAATYNITINGGTIDGSTSLVLNNNWASIDLIFNGTNWSII